MIENSVCLFVWMLVEIYPQHSIYTKAAVTSGAQFAIFNINKSAELDFYHIIESIAHLLKSLQQWIIVI